LKDAIGLQDVKNYRIDLSIGLETKSDSVEKIKKYEL
jgi:hypothetical protein